MGLDMYLYQQTRGEPLDLAAIEDEQWDEMYDQIAWRHPDWEAESWYGDRHLKEADRPYEVTKIAYWRKANQIHAWFVDNVQGGVDECDYCEVNLEQLAGLRTTCQRVLADPTLAEELLPPRAGFFFGSYEIDEWYMSDLKETVDQIDAIMESARTHQGPIRIWYHSSW